jgi:hypothetical protein
MTARWYMVNSLGWATLCANAADAKATADDANWLYPNKAPHRAVQLVEISAVAEAVAAEREAWLEKLTRAAWYPSSIFRHYYANANGDWVDLRELEAVIRARKDTHD